MIQENTKFFSNVPASVLTEVQNVAELHGVPEVWLFGSATNPDQCKKPNDIDIALLGIQPDKINVLSEFLKQNFPSSKIESAIGYTDYTCQEKGKITDGELPFHFVFGTPDMQKLNHPIFSSINSGMCLYRAD